jgi:hypothetical protein
VRSVDVVVDPPFFDDPLPSDAPALVALREVIAATPPAALRELYALTRIGPGSPRSRGLASWPFGAELLGDDVLAGTRLEDTDLREHIAKGLYETRRW